MKKSFLLYLDYKPHLDLIKDNGEYRKLMDGIFEYQLSGTVPDLSPLAGMAFSFIKTNIDRDNEKYGRVCERNRKNGMLGGKPKKPSGLSGLPKNPVAPDIEIDIDIDNEKDIDIDIERRTKKTQGEKCVICDHTKDLLPIGFLDSSGNKITRMYCEKHYREKQSKI